MTQQPQLNIWQHKAARLQAVHRVAVALVLGDAMQIDSNGCTVKSTPIAAAVAADAPLSPADSNSIGPLTQPSVASEARAPALAESDARSQSQSQQSESNSGGAEAAPLTPLVRPARHKRKAR